MRAGWGAGRGVDGVTTNLLQFTDTKKKEESKGGVVRRRRRRESDTTMPAILFLSSAATAFVAMTTQADDLIAVTFECCSLKEPATQNRKQTGSTHTHAQGLPVLRTHDAPAVMLINGDPSTLSIRHRYIY